MAHATELTITMGRAHHSGDPQSDGCISQDAHGKKTYSREARVSVTWRLGEDEQDLALMTSVLGEEAERALDAACRAARGRREEPCQEEPCGREVTYSPSANGSATNSAAATASPAQPQHNGNHGSGPNGSGSVPYATGRTVAASNPSGSHSPGSTRAASRRKRSAVAAPPTVPPPPSGDGISAPQQITAPQRLAIRALCHRLEVQEMDLKLLLDERFGKQGIEDLSKEEAGALLVALQRGEWEEADQPAFAN